MGKTRKEKKSVYDEIRKPVPKPGFPFKTKKKQYRFEDDDDSWETNVNDNIIKRIKNG